MKKLIWLTDLHLVEQGQDWPQGVDPLARLRLCLDEIAAVHCDADRLVVTGDLIQLRNPGPTPSCVRNWSGCRFRIAFWLETTMIVVRSDQYSLQTTALMALFKASRTSMAHNCSTSTHRLLTASIMANYAPPESGGSPVRSRPPVRSHC